MSYNVLRRYDGSNPSGGESKAQVADETGRVRVVGALRVARARLPERDLQSVTLPIDPNNSHPILEPTRISPLSATGVVEEAVDSDRRSFGGFSQPPSSDHATGEQVVLSAPSRAFGMTCPPDGNESEHSSTMGRVASDAPARAFEVARRMVSHGAETTGPADGGQVVTSAPNRSVCK